MKSILFWSSGKDSAYALHQLIRAGKKPELLLCTIDEKDKTVPIHEVGEALIKLQSESMGIPLRIVYYAASHTVNTYENELLKTLHELKAEGFDTVISGDLFLDDIRQYRIQLHNKAGFNTEFPLWGWDTTQLASNIMNEGFKAVVVSVDTKFLNAEYCGKLFNKEFFSSLPAGIDPCGENGEYHTFVFDGPVFKNPINISAGEKKMITMNQGKVYETTMCYTELKPANN